MFGFKNLFRKRRRLAQGRQADLYQYTGMTEKFRTQVWHIWDKVGKSDSGYVDPHVNRMWQDVYDSTILEEGIPNDGRHYNSPLQWCCVYLMETQSEGALKLIERSFQVVCRYFPVADTKPAKAAESSENDIVRTFIFPAGYMAQNSIDDLNGCFKQNNLGYEFVGGKLMRIDSTHIHNEVVKPTIALLNDAGFPGPLQEFFEAHEHYKADRHKDAITSAERAFESTMKAICADRGWKPAKVKLEKANASDLINLILNNGLIPEFMRDHLCGLDKVLNAGLPTVRNNMGGHGQGADPVAVDAYVARYALNMAATNIVFLVEAHQAKSQ